MASNIGVKRITETAKLPTRATTEAAGWDVYADETFTLDPHRWALISTGICLNLVKGMEAQVRSRSGLAVKHGVCVLNSPGTIDSDYTGEVRVLLINHGNIPFVINPGDRIAQLVFAKVAEVEVREVTDLRATERGDKGFGSTGV